MNWDLLFRFSFHILLFTISSYSQNFIGLADKDSFAYVTMNDKILFLGMTNQTIRVCQFIPFGDES
jgi:hypothetical protein